MNFQKKAFQLFTLVASTVIVMSSCSSKNEDDTVVVPPSVDTVVTGTLSANKTLTSDRTWILKGYVYVPNGITLTIQPGTTIKSDISQKGALIVERGGKLEAAGTADRPIVFTSGKAAGSREPGDWGGIILLGNARTNRSTPPVIEGGVDRVYGGTNDADNSGTLRYVRIEYAGIAAFPGSEINGLTLGGVGSGTTIEYVQVSYGNDDAFEFFGGTVNAKYLVAAYTADDDFDFDFGYRGNLQYGVALRDPAFVDAGDAGNGVECDNDGTGTTASPFTEPVISNFTWVGPNNASGTAANHNFGMRWRRATKFRVFNSILMGWQKGGFSVESMGTADSLKSGSTRFRYNLVHAVADPFRRGSDATAAFAANADVETLLTNTTNANVKYASANDINLTAPFNLTAPNLLPNTGSPALTGANFTDLSGNSFFTSTTFRGAFGTTNWMQGWTRFYTKGN